MDQTFIKNLLLQGIIGITEQERSQPQDILINITLYGDAHKAGVSDNIKDCINYATIVKKTTAFVEKASRFTVEALASDIANLCLQEKGVKGVRVRVEKPTAIQAAQSVGVEIERQAINDVG
jgi:FolB domain-containing protein